MQIVTVVTGLKWEGCTVRRPDMLSGVYSDCCDWAKMVGLYSELHMISVRVVHSLTALKATHMFYLKFITM